MTLDFIKLAEQADNYADEKIAQPGESHPDWHKVRDERYAALVLEAAEKACKEIQQRHSADTEKAIEAQLWEDHHFSGGCAAGAEECVEAIRTLRPKD